ncbi:MAG: GTP cyclohydrolase I, partial [Rickettsiales bacterium]|nr:GTP cyclohydrolase I [Rickettsiales bacterium]
MRNVKRLEKLIGLLIGAMGEDVNREGLIETPERALRGWSELLCGYSYDDSKLYKTFKFTGSEFITVRGIEFTSICEHHLLPFYGLVTV